MKNCDKRRSANAQTAFHMKTLRMIFLHENESHIMPRYCVLYEQHPQSSDAALYKAESQSRDADFYKVYSQSSDAIPEYARFAKIAKPVLYEEKHQNERMHSWGLKDYKAVVGRVSPVNE